MKIHISETTVQLEPKARCPLVYGHSFSSQHKIAADMRLSHVTTLTGMHILPRRMVATGQVEWRQAKMKQRKWKGIAKQPPSKCK
jgi:hypothetical protein